MLADELHLLDSIRNVLVPDDDALHLVEVGTQHAGHAQELFESGVIGNPLREGRCGRA